MKQYLLSIFQPDGEKPSPELLEPVMRKVNALLAETKATGAWDFNGGLFDPTTSSVVRLKGGDVLVTDGPYTEGKEHVGGFLVVAAPDLDAALDWGRKLAEALTLPGHSDSLPIEVRPFEHTGEPA
jgi:hypothetical protein